MIEYREGELGCEVRGMNDSDHTLELSIVKYGVADSYGSVWEPDVFAESLRSKLPAAAWAHNHERIIGGLKEHDERADGLDGLVQFADFDAVPDAKMAWSVMKAGYIKDTSFGFKRQDWADTRADPKLDGETHRMQRCRLDEVSPVLVGAVPGAGAISVRSDGHVAWSSVQQLFTLVRQGILTERDVEVLLEARAQDAAESRTEPEEDLPFLMPPTEVELALDLMRFDELIDERADVKPGDGNEAQLKRYWASGEGAAKIRWGTAGDHTRCVHQLSKYVGPGVVHGLCTNIQKQAIGHAGNKTPAEKGRAADPDVTNWLTDLIGS